MIPSLELTAFSSISVKHLGTLSREQIDGLEFGVVGFSSDGIVEIYNARESELAGLPFDSVIGSHFFSSTAQCMNNFLVAQRFEDEPELDAVIDYVLTLRMRPTPVQLRLLKSPDASRRYILIQR